MFRFFRRSNKKSVNDKIENNLSVSEIFDQALIKHHLSVDGAEFFDKGKIFTDKAEADEYCEKNILPRFENLRLDVLAQRTEAAMLFEAEAEKANIKVTAARKNLDENNPYGILGKIKKEINDTETKQEEFENLSLPQKKFQFYLGRIFEQFQKNLTKIISAEGDDNKIILAAIQQKVNVEYTNREVSFLKRFLDSISSKIHSAFYPPRKKYIRLFFGFCIAFLIGEIGFSYVIITNLANTGFTDWRDDFLKVIYSVCISLALATFYKLLIEGLLYRKVWKLIIFFVVHFAIVFIISVFFSSEYNTVKFTITQKGVMLGFFSCSFAMANAFLFREASYLSLLYRNLYPVYNMQDLKLMRDNETRNLELQIQQNEGLIKEYKNKAKMLRDDQATEFTTRVNNLKDIATSNFWSGFNKNIEDSIVNNTDLVIAMIKNLKDKLK